MKTGVVNGYPELLHENKSKNCPHSDGDQFIALNLSFLHREVCNSLK